MRKSVDIETALYELLTADGYSASAHSVPATLGNDFPHVHVVGQTVFNEDLVRDVNTVAFDIYAATQADAMEAASDLTAWVRDLVGEIVGTPCYQAEIINKYPNPDPRHPNIGRATIRAQITIRIQEVN